jgi:tyrosinase
MMACRGRVFLPTGAKRHRRPRSDLLLSSLLRRPRFLALAKKARVTDKLEIIPEYPKTDSVDSQGPTPGTAANSWLTLASPLDPFKKTENGKERAYTSFDCINIERQLGYTYAPGSLEQPAELMAALPAAVANLRTVIVTGINRARVRGSFLITLERRRY